MIEDDVVERLTPAIERLFEEQMGELLEQLVPRLVAELVPHLRWRPTRRPDPAQPLVDTATVARYLSMSEAWVRGHATQLRVRRLTSHPNSAMRFSLVEVDELLLRTNATGAGDA